MTTLNQGNTLRDIIRWEADEGHRYAREVVTVKMGENLAMGTVIGIIKAALSSPEYEADAGNAGALAISGVATGTEVKPGAYTITTLVAAEASPVVAASFSVTAPDGTLLPNAGIGAYVNPQISFTLAQGSPEAVVGDKWTITIAEGSNQVVAYDPNYTDGSEDGYGILIADADATSAAVDAVAVVRNAIVIEANLVWKTLSPVISAAQKAAVMAQLAAKGIITRLEA